MAIFKKGIHANMLLDPIGPFTVLGRKPSAPNGKPNWKWEPQPQGYRPRSLPELVGCLVVVAAAFVLNKPETVSAIGWEGLLKKVSIHGCTLFRVTAHAGACAATKILENNRSRGVPIFSR